MCDREYVEIELDFSNQALELLEKISDKTGFSYSQIVEYALADRIMQDAIKEIQAEN